jgi:hypothetical protein
MSTYVNKAPSTQSTLRTRTLATKVAALASLAFGFTFFWTVASIDVPHKASDSKLLHWWQQGVNLNSALASEFFAISTAILMLVIVNHLIALAPDRDRWAGFVNSMATVFASTMLISAALRGVIAHQVKRFEEPLPPVDVLRYSTGLNYTVLGSVGMTAFALTVIAVSVLVLRTHILASWMAYVGFGCGAVVVVAVAAMYGGFTVPIAILWALCMSVAIWRQPAA